jgi:hypothetical protein
MTKTPSEVWWRCTRCGRSVHNHSPEGVKEINPRVCKKEVVALGGKRKGCVYVLDEKGKKR